MSTAPAAPGQNKPQGHRRMTCVGCRYYFITYEPGFPYGCQLLGFKSRRAPIIEVYAATQADCQGYEPRS